jgi:AAA15 family ATPase/GTPase
MIKNLEIKNFKSIKHLKLDCKRINLFIGEPNTGKSNILESFGILSSASFGGLLRDFVRIERLNNLFYDENLRESIKIRADDLIFVIEFKQKTFRGNLYSERVDLVYPLITFDYDLKSVGKTTYTEEDFTKFFKFYKFKVLEDYPNQESEFLYPPSGSNLLAILKPHRDLKKLIKLIFDKYGLKVVLKPQENKIEVQKEVEEDIVIAYPYSLVSDTLQRIIFHLAAIETNKDSVIAFEEPEAHAFPYYTKFLAERIALDKNNNQYFISTHNPYLLLSILEKAHKDEVAILITYFEDYQTKVKPLSEKELEEIMDLGVDIFFNIERFLEVQE